MNIEELGRIREINATKKHGHCAFLLSYIDVLEQQSSAGERDSRIDCLAMFVRRLLRIMRMNGLGDREVCQQADRYLKAIGATGSILRDEDIQEQSK